MKKTVEYKGFVSDKDGFKECKKIIDEFGETDFVTNNRYLVEFPDEYGIPAYCVRRLWHGNDKSVVMEIVEPYFFEGPVMSERLTKLSKGRGIVIRHRILYPDLKEYYTEKLYVKDGCIVFRPQTVGYDVDGLRIFSVYLELERLTAEKHLTGANGEDVLVESEIGIA